MSKTNPDKQPLLSLRSAVVLLFAVLIGGVAGGLTYFSGSRNVATAVIAGITAFAAAVIWLDTVIAP